jgi:cellulose synthase/poly-beta-1,6-N-acetylglucosamine synthase-like glycosyltransferase
MNPTSANGIDRPSFCPQVSAIVPIYNGETDIPDLIRGLQNQTYPRDRVEYLLVDNGSRDRTFSLLETAASEAKSLGLTFKALQESQIQSSYAARNAGIRVARGEILAFTDADCRPQPNWLENLVQPFTKAEVGLVVGEIVGLPGTSLLEKHAERNNVLSQQHTLEHPFFPYGQTANLAIRREALEQVGLFRPYLTTGGDADICWRIQQQSDWQLEFAPTAIVRHRHRSTLEEYQKQWRRYGRSNRYLHELHGVKLMRNLQPKDCAYLLSRWFLKELPITSLKAIAGKTSPLDLINTPVGVIGAWARASGQREAKLPEEAKEIEWLPQAQGASSTQPPSDSSVASH